jgi:hypothetical protein
MTMAAALIAAVTEIDLKRFKFASVQGRESVCALLALLLSRWGDGGQGKGRRGVLASTYEIKILSLDSRDLGVEPGPSCN